jgi:hypothetical protein
MSGGCSQTLQKKVGDACPQGALTHYQESGGRMSLGCSKKYNFLTIAFCALAPDFFIIHFRLPYGKLTWDKYTKQMGQTSSENMVKHRQKTLSKSSEHMVNNRQNTWSHIVEKHGQTSSKTWQASPMFMCTRPSPQQLTL